MGKGWKFLISSWLLALTSTVAAAPLKVLTSIAPLALITADLGGPWVETQTLLPANSDPHDFALRISDLQRLQQAQLVIWLGPEFERFLAKPMASHTSDQLPLGELPALHWPDHTQGRDLHLWLDPDNVALFAQAISSQLQRLLPDQRLALQERLQQFNQRLAASSQSLSGQLAPLKSRPLAVYHNGYGHWLHHFGLQQRLALTEMPNQHASAKQVAEAQAALVGVSCLITDFNEGNRAALAQLYALPILVADPLAQSRRYRDFPDFFNALGQVFLTCLAQVP